MIVTIAGILWYTRNANAQVNRPFELKDGKYQLTMEGAAHFADLPLRCMQREFPYKTGVAFPDSTLAVKPKVYHPAFYGCYDWHSSVHGHWMLVRLLKLFPFHRIIHGFLKSGDPEDFAVFFQIIQQVLMVF